MIYSVHYFDRRTGEYRVIEEAHDFEGAYWWSQGSAASDDNRSLVMYRNEPAMQLQCCYSVNLIQIDKVVADGEVIYRERVCPLPARVLAFLLGREHFCLLTSLAEEKFDQQALLAAVAKLQETRAALAVCENTQTALQIIDQAAAIASNWNSAGVAWAALDALEVEFLELAGEAAAPFEEPERYDIY